MIDEGAFVHHLAQIDDTVSIGAGSKVWQFATLIRGARLGRDCSMAPGACLDGSRLGDRSILGHNVAMGPGFWVGDDVFIGPNSVISNDAWPRADKEHFDASLFDGAQWAVVLEDGAAVGACAVVLPGVRIGSGAMIAAGAVVERSVPAHHLLTREGEMRPLTDAIEARKISRRMRFAARDVEAAA